MRQISRRTFLTATATLISGLVVACRELSPEPPEAIRQLTPVPSLAPDAPTTTSRPAIPAATPTRLAGLASNADGYVAVAPRVLRAGQQETVSMSLFRGTRAAEGMVAVALLRDGKDVVRVDGNIAGRGSLPLDLARVAPGSYELQVQGKGFKDQATVKVESGTLVFVETDKPIYKPGQTIAIRVLTLDPLLRPSGGEATVEIMDAQGIKVFRQTVTPDEWGMATLELPLSTEPNLGVWKAVATVGDRSAQLDVRVERYVLPKYEITVDLAKSWALPGEAIKGTLAAEYSFGKPVKGEYEIVAYRYVGVWEEYTRVTKSIDGKDTFELPPVQYASGSPVDGGQASARLDITVREQATGYEEETSRLVTIAQSPVMLRIIPESQVFKPGLSFALLVVAETPDKQPVDARVELTATYTDENFAQVRTDTKQVSLQNGLAVVELAPPTGAVSLELTASAPDASGAPVTVRAGYSPSGNFIHIEQLTRGDLQVGGTARFQVRTTRESVNIYYEVLARGQVVFSDVTQSPEIAIALGPQMAPEARLLVYQLLPNAEVAADWMPFTVQGVYPHRVEASFSQAEVTPGQELDVQLQTEGPARIGLAAVDRSVFILAENRLNLQQVFAELERLFMQPQAEIHEAEPMIDPFGPIITPGARETFQDAGVLVLSNRQVPEGKQLESPMRRGVVMEAAGGPAVVAPAAADSAAPQSPATGQALAEPTRVRQFFPETWLWTAVTSDAAGRATHHATAPDSITTWMLRAVALSKEHGLGIAEAELRVFQPFFVQLDLPYSAIRREEFPVKVALYNYQQAAQEFVVEIEPADWFDLLDEPSKKATVDANSVGAAEFMIRPTRLGVNALRATARSASSADALVKDLIVEPEGVARERVENIVLAPGAARALSLPVPSDAIEGSPRAYLALTGNVLSQTLDGLESLLQMPFGCGEQNMILFAPNVFVMRYLKETGQIKPEIVAKAEKLMLTGYQRELTYRRSDGSFSAFGQQDAEGSLWLTAFVLKTFAQARGLIFIDESVLQAAGDWITGHQRSDGSFEPIGFIHHQDLLGGLQGTTALTAYMAIALRESGDAAGAGRAVRYLEAQLDTTDDAYALAITAYALALAGSNRAQAAQDKLMALAQHSDEGLFWDNAGVRPLREGGSPPIAGDMPVQSEQTAAIETTGYAALALLTRGDKLNAGQAVRWLAAQRNAFGGFGSTQDTVVALQALATAASAGRADIDATITLAAGDWRKEVRIAADNADVLQIVEVPLDERLEMASQGKGQVTAQSVLRYNVPAMADTTVAAFTIDISYDTTEIEVGDRLTINASITYTPPEPIPAGMVVLDIAVPTGFAPVAATLDTLVQEQSRLKRWDQAGRKVILYIEDMQPDEHLALSFQAQALYPVKAQPVTSQVYSYYRPAWKAEHLGPALRAGRA